MVGYWGGGEICAQQLICTHFLGKNEEKKLSMKIIKNVKYPDSYSEEFPKLFVGKLVSYMSDKCNKYKSQYKNPKLHLLTRVTTNICRKNTGHPLCKRLL